MAGQLLDEAHSLSTSLSYCPSKWMSHPKRFLGRETGMKLQGKGIVITGANRGLGKEIARACVAEGANVMLCARDGEILEQTCGELKQIAADGQHVLGQVADVSKVEEVAELISCAEEDL